MAQKELVFKLKFVDENGQIVEKTAQSIKDINKSITDLKSELENTELGSEAWNELATDLGKAENALGKVGEAQQKAKESSKSFTDSLSSLPGPLGGVIQGAKALNASLLKLVANPIGAVIAAVVVALTALYKAFTSTKAGGEKMEQVMAGIGAALDVLRDRVLKVGGAIVKFFSGDFAGAADDMKEAFSGIGDEIASEFNQAMKIKAELQSIADATRELNKQRAEQNKEIAKAKLVINDETKSIKEREAALEQVRQAEIALAKQEELLAQRRYEAIKAQNALSDSSKEALEEEAQAYIALQNAQLASLQKQKELFDQQKALRDKDKAERQARYNEIKANLKALNDFEQNLMLESIQNEEEKAKKQLEIQRQNQLDQIKELKASNERKKELILQVEANTQYQRQKLEQESYTKSLENVKAFRAQLIAQELLYSDASVKLAETLADQQIKQTLEDLDLDYHYWSVRNKSIEDYKKNQDKLLHDTNEAYDRYYATQKFEADQLFQYDMSLTAEREEERKRQLEEARLFAEKERKMKEDAYKKEHNTETIATADFQKMRLEERQRYLDAEAQINGYFDNYETARTKQHQATIANIEQEQQEKKLANMVKFNQVREKIRQQEQAAEQASLQLATASLDTLADLAGRESALGKTLAIASTTISTYQAAQQAYASQLTIPTPDAPVRAAIAAGIAIAQGLARVVAIQNTDTDVRAADGMVVGNGSGRADNVPVMVSNGETIINARSSKMFRGLLSSINQAGGGRRFASGGITSMTTQTSPEQNFLNQIATQGGQPVKTYVVSTEMSSSQALDRQIKSRSVL